MLREPLLGPSLSELGDMGHIRLSPGVGFLLVNELENTPLLMRTHSFLLQ